MLAALGEAALRTLLLAAIVQLGLWLLRIQQAQLLLIAWTVVLAASLAMPALQWATPLRLPFVTGLSSTSLIDAADPQLQPLTPQASGPVLADEIQDPPTMLPWLEAVYLLVSSTLLLRLAVGVALALRLLGRAAPVRLEWAAGARVRISRDVTGPVTVANVIVLPADVVDWPSPMRQAVLAHERAHVARWDFAMLLVSQVNRALFWFSPLSWWLHRRLAALAELASDDHAMEITGDRPGYAETLLEMGRRSGPLLRGVAMARQSTLRYRIERILSGCVKATPVSRNQRVVLAMGAVVLSIAAASQQSNPIASSDLTAIAEQQNLPAFPEAGPAPSAQATADAPEPMPVPPPQTRVASLAPPPATPASAGAVPAATLRLSQAVRVAARPMPHPTRNTLVLPPTHAARQPNRSLEDPDILVASPSAEAVSSAAVSHQATDGLVLPNGGRATIGDDSQALAAAKGRATREPPLLKLIDNRTCSGVYMPDHAAGFVSGSIDLVRAKFFRDASGAPWLTFFLGGHVPVIQPVTVTQGDGEVPASHNTVFTMVPRSARRLNGFIQHPYGTIDFACGGSYTHLFDGA